MHIYDNMYIWFQITSIYLEVFHPETWICQRFQQFDEDLAHWATGPVHNKGPFSGSISTTSSSKHDENVTSPWDRITLQKTNISHKKRKIIFKSADC